MSSNGCGASALPVAKRMGQLILSVKLNGQWIERLIGEPMELERACYKACRISSDEHWRNYSAGFKEFEFGAVFNISRDRHPRFLEVLLVKVDSEPKPALQCHEHLSYVGQTCPDCGLEVDAYGNTEQQFDYCCAPDCGCEGSRTCMAPSGFKR
jgi:hypothetical protein